MVKKPKRHFSFSIKKPKAALLFRQSRIMISHIQPVPCILEGDGGVATSHVTEVSIQATPPQVVGYDDVGDGVKDKLDVVGVGGAGHMGVHFLVGRLVLGLVLTLDVGDALQVSVGT